MKNDLNDKLMKLKAYLRELGSVAVAFSGGVDSTFLLRVARETLGDKCIAFTAASVFVPQRDVEEAKAFAEKEGVHHILKTFDVLALEGIRMNPEDRCYRCKYALFSQFKELAAQKGLNFVVDGSNRDDDGDYRPGRRALRELDIKSPLYYAGMTKQDIRCLSEEMGLPTWNKPSFACLASRFVYGEELSAEKLDEVNRAEEYLLRKGVRQFRVRRHGNLARIELLPEEISRFMEPELRQEIADAFKAIGFDYVTMDLQGYRTGSMNESLDVRGK
ncbi:uncharacterized protein SAMN05216584_102294 [Selenomonas sp. WCT3]|uniref:ATP-dependent sacrificial sulfur transferase LarE n=1 Tax=Selenomonas sp. WCT3 TaxID=3158785 RepID=UPI000883CBC8|nr:uncharacterized protein SAMN05216584_102294 [Selenomonas ruminantium]